MDAVSGPGENGVQITSQLRKCLMRRFLKEPGPCSDELLSSIQKIEQLSSAKNTDTIIATVDAIYNNLYYSW